MSNTAIHITSLKSVETEFTTENRSVFTRLGLNAATGLKAESAALQDALRVACGDPDQFGVRTIRFVPYYNEARDAFTMGYIGAYYECRKIDPARASAKDEKRGRHAATQAWSMRLEIAKINPPVGGRGRPKSEKGTGATTRKAEKNNTEVKLTRSQKALANKVSAMRKIVNHAEKAGIKCATAVHKAMSDALTAYNKSFK